MDVDILPNGFKLEWRDCIRFRTNTHGESVTLLNPSSYLQSYGLNSATRKMALALHNPQKLICHQYQIFSLNNTKGVDMPLNNLKRGWYAIEYPKKFYMPLNNPYGVDMQLNYAKGIFKSLNNTKGFDMPLNKPNQTKPFFGVK